MKISGFECVLGPSGHTRAVAGDSDTGNAVWIDGRLIAQTDIPREVLEWLIRPMLREAWEAGCVIGLGCPPQTNTEEAYGVNPWKGELPNKDNDPS